MKLITPEAQGGLSRTRELIAQETSSQPVRIGFLTPWAVVERYFLAMGRDIV
jgi:hypothetical protein